MSNIPPGQKAKRANAEVEQNFPRKKLLPFNLGFLPLRLIKPTHPQFLWLGMMRLGFAITAVFPPEQ